MSKKMRSTGRANLFAREFLSKQRIPSVNKRDLLLSSILASGLLLVNIAGSDPAHAVCVDDDANSSTCSGTNSIALNYPGDNALFAGGDFTLTFNSATNNNAANTTLNLTGAGENATLNINGGTYTPTAGTVFDVDTKDGNITAKNVIANEITAVGGDGINAKVGSGAGTIDISVIGTTVIEGGGGTGIVTSAVDGDTTIDLQNSNGVKGDAGVSATATGTGGITVKNKNGAIITGSVGNGLTTSANNGNTVIELDDGVTGAAVGVSATATGSGDITITTDTKDDGGIVMGGTDGISTSAQDGKTTIVTNDDVIGTAGDGIAAQSTTGEISITSNDTVKGGDEGITASATGAAKITIQANKSVTGVDGNGISASSAGGDVKVTVNDTVTAGNVILGADGIEAKTSGDGTVEVVTATDKLVEGKTGDGIEAVSENGNITITANGEVKGNFDGIDARASGTGDVTIQTEKAVTATLFNGISSSSKGGTIKVTANDAVTGGDDGIELINTGDGTIEVITAADKLVEGQGQDGIRTLSENGKITITANGEAKGLDTGITAVASGTGAITIVAEKAVTGTTDDGLIASSNGGNISVTVNSTVTGGGDGIQSKNTGDGEIEIITAAGELVEGQKGDGINTEAENGKTTITANGPVTGSLDGIEADATGTGNITILAEQAVIGNGGDGIRGSSQGGDYKVTANDTVTGTNDGIDVSTNGDGIVEITTTKDKLVEGQGGDGIFSRAADGDTTITANGPITGSDEGINAGATGSGDITILAEQAVEGTTADGIKTGAVGGKTDITTNSTVTGGEDGIDTIATGAGDITILAEKAVIGNGGDGIRGSSQGGNYKVTANDTVTGTNDGIDVTTNGDGTVEITTTKDKLVEGQGGDGIFSRAADGDTTITANGPITGSDEGINAGASGDGKITILAEQAITGTGGTGINTASKGGDVKVTANSTVSGGGDGIAAKTIGNGEIEVTTATDKLVEGQKGDGINTKADNGETTITANGPVKGSIDGIDATAVGTGGITILAEQAVEGVGQEGIFAQAQSGNVKVTANDTVTGGRFGIFASTIGAGTVEVITTKDKLVEGKGFDGINTSADNGLTTITANGPVKGNVDGIEAVANGIGPIIVLAEQSVEGVGGDGIRAAASGGNVKVTAKDTVKGGSGSGIEASSVGAGTVEIITTAGKLVEGSSDGITARAGIGKTTIIANGPVTGTLADGIDAQSQGGDIDITANDEVSGGNEGIEARTIGAGTIDITTAAGKAVTGGNSDGIVTSAVDGKTTIMANGPVESKTVGTGIESRSALGDIDITTKDTVKGVAGGIDAQASSAGNITVLAEGAVSSTGAGNGITARSQGGNIEVTALDKVTVGGIGGNGISTSTIGVGTIKITTTADKLVSAIDNGIFSSAEAGTTTIIANGPVTSIVNDGIDARTVTGAVDITTAEAVKGNDNGIIVAASDKADITILAKGTVQGVTKTGIEAVSVGGNVKVTVEDTVNGGKSGILASTTLDGTIEVTTTKDKLVEGDEGDGIATSAENGITTIIANGPVTGKNKTADGINAQTVTGAVNITTAQAVNGNVEGIEVLATGAADITILTKGTVQGDNNSGIKAVSAGGDVKVTSQDIVTGAGALADDNAGILAETTGTGTVTVQSDKAVQGNGNGILTRAVDGDTQITANDTVKGDDGIDAETTGKGSITILAQKDVTGTGSEGITTRAQDGNIEITSNGNVQAGAGGILGTTNLGGDVTVNANGSVNSDTSFGISASSFGGGNIKVTSKDDVTGGDSHGIEATSDFLGASAGSVQVTTAADKAVIGKNGAGILTEADDGLTTIIANGATEGSLAGISATSAGGVINITNNGTVENFNGGVDDPVAQDSQLAIQTDVGPATIDNNGTVTGRVTTGGMMDVFNNFMNWVTGGTSDFGGGDDVVNNSGTLTAANEAGVSETTSLQSLETLNNGGVISLQDQMAGDGSTQFDRLVVSGDYAAGMGGELQLDAALGGPGSKADVLEVQGDTSGSTNITITDVDSGTGALNADGIALVEVGGTTDQSHFSLTNGPIQKGLFVYDLFLDGTTHELRSELGLPAFEPSRIITSIQNMSHEGTGLWLDRQADLRSITANGRRPRVNAAACTGYNCGNGDVAVWVKALGSVGERDSTAATPVGGGILNFDLSYSQNIYGIFGGADFGTHSGDTTFLFGGFAGYLNSDVDFDVSGSSANVTGAQVGGYVTALNNGFFADILGKVDIFNLDYSIPTVGSDEADVFNFGFHADAGYRFGANGVFVEPIASVAWLQTHVDNYNLGGTTVDNETATSLRAGGGVRVGIEANPASGGTVEFSALGRIWNEFEGNNDTNILSNGQGFTASDDSSGIFGEASALVNWQLNNTTSMFIKGGAKFDEDAYQATGTAGIRFNW